MRTEADEHSERLKIKKAWAYWFYYLQKLITGSPLYKN